MKRKKFSLFVCAGVFLIVLAVSVVLFVIPRPIVDDLDKVYKLDYISYTNGVEADDYYLSEEHADEILECLSRYKERRTLFRPKPGTTDDWIINVWIHANDEFCKTVSLEKHDSYSNGKFWYAKIINADELISEILEIIED